MSRLTIDELEMLNPDELYKLLNAEVSKDSQDVQFIQDLIAVGCPIDDRDEYGWTVLHWAAEWGHLEIVEFLISEGADLDTRDNTSWTPLHCAARMGHFEMVKFLISKGAYVDARNYNGQSAWDLASNELKASCPELEPK